MSTIRERGTIYHLSEISQGTSKSGNAWQRQSIVFEVSAGHNSVRRVVCNAGTQMVAEVNNNFKKGDLVEFSYIVSARDWQGKWYANIDLVEIAPVKSGKRAAQPEPEPTPAPAFDVAEDKDGDLPF